MAVNYEVLALILGGGQGSRLFPLTSHRSKPAVPIGGRYRLIDIPSATGNGYCIRDGIIVVPKDGVIKPGTRV